MRGSDRQTAKLFSYVSPDGLVPHNHPLRPIRALVNAALDRLSPEFAAIYSDNGRPSIAPEKLLRALRTPHHDLAAAQVMVARVGVAAFTRTALDGGRAMGLTSAEMLETVSVLDRADFYKAMTCYGDTNAWQGVYHAAVSNGKIYPARRCAGYTV